jgi:hypothetical protein
VRGVAIGALVVLLVLAPIVSASHNMGHRYIVHGRLLDATGMPVQDREVEIRLFDGATERSSIFTRTNCLGDFESYQGRVGLREGPNTPHGGGEIEQVPASANSPGYVNFHFQDVWTEKFVSAHRQTVARHQLAATYPAAAACGGNFDQFNRTLTVHLFISTPLEMNTAEVSVKARTANIAYGGNSSEGRLNFMSTFIANLGNVTLNPDERVQITATDIGSINPKLSAEDLRFHRRDEIHVVGSAATGASLDDLRNLGIIVLVVALGVGLYFASQRFKAKREENRLMQTSSRRRFRKQRGGEGGEQ